MLISLGGALGSGWESNPPRPVQRPATGFEDRGAHRGPTTPRFGKDTLPPGG